MSEKEPKQLELQPGFLSIHTDGKDELNLAEFPIAAAANRIDPDKKTLVFEDEITDKETGKNLPRRLTITGSDQYGLPVALDEEVILGLVNLSKLQGFRSREVPFNRSQLIRILGWKDDGYYYRRVKESLNRWLGVTLYYDNAWRDKGRQKWISDGFHLIDNVSWDDGNGQASITWNKLIFQSFQSGNLKALDLGVLRQLSKPLARRLYRFLDKRFFYGSSFTIDVLQLARNKLGISRAYVDVGQIKRNLKPAIKQLEEAKFLHPMTDAERYRKIRPGHWEITFRKYSQAELDQLKIPLHTKNHPKALSDEALEAQLSKHGVSAKQAKFLCAAYPPEHIRERIAWLEWRLKHDPGVSKIENLPGYLVHSIKSETYQAPSGFVRRVDVSRHDESEHSKKAVPSSRQKRRQRANLAQDKARNESYQAARKYFLALSDAEQQKIRRRALSRMPVSSPELQESVVMAEVMSLLSRGGTDR